MLQCIWYGDATPGKCLFFGGHSRFLMYQISLLESLRDEYGPRPD